MVEQTDEIIKGIIYSVFGESGPEPIAWWPEIDRQICSIVSLKSIALLTGEEGKVPARIATFPFPSFGLNSILLFFEIPNKNPNIKRNLRDCTLTLLINDKFSSLIYKYLEIFESKLKKIADLLIDANSKGFTPQQIFLKKVYEDFVNISNTLRTIELEKEKQSYSLQDQAKKIKYQFKVVCIGDVAVGKTTLFLRYIDNTFQELYKPTVGIETRIKDIIIGHKPVRIFLYDIAGQEKFATLNPTFFSGADAIIILYDVTQKTSFSQGATKWYKEFLKHSTQKFKVGILVGNKIDLLRERTIKTEWGAELARKMKFGFTEISAKTGENVNNIFSILFSKLYEKARISA